jgi:hypothetical protein
MWVTENSVIHIDRSEKSVIHIDWAARPPWVMEFSIAHRLCYCVTLGFFLTVSDQIQIHLRISIQAVKCEKLTSLYFVSISMQKEKKLAGSLTVIANCVKCFRAQSLH